jgi:hypothetical protein
MNYIVTLLKAHYDSEILFLLLRNVKNLFYNVLIMDLKQIRCLSTEKSCAEYAVMCRKGSKMLTKEYFDFHTKYSFTI